MAHKDHYEKLITDEITYLKNSIDYCNEALAAELEPWERKEYEYVLELTVEQLKKSTEHYQYLNDNNYL